MRNTLRSPNNPQQVYYRFRQKPSVHLGVISNKIARSSLYQIEKKLSRTSDEYTFVIIKTLTRRGLTTNDYNEDPQVDIDTLLTNFSENHGNFSSCIDTFFDENYVYVVMANGAN